MQPHNLANWRSHFLKQAGTAYVQRRLIPDEHKQMHGSKLIKESNPKPDLTDF